MTNERTPKEKHPTPFNITTDCTGRGMQRARATLPRQPALPSLRERLPEVGAQHLLLGHDLPRVVVGLAAVPHHAVNHVFGAVHVVGAQADAEQHVEADCGGGGGWWWCVWGMQAVNG